MNGITDIQDYSDELTDLRATLRGIAAPFTTLTPWRVYRDIAVTWLIITATITTAIYYDNVYVYLLAMLVISTQQHALGILGHEGCHFRITSNRALNSFIADFFCWLPISFNNTRYGYEHILHHKNLNTEGDPYWSDFQTDQQFWWPKKRREAFCSLLQSITGIHFAKLFLRGNRWGPFYLQGIPLSSADKLTAAAFYLLLIIGLWATSGWWYFLLLWVVPLITFTWWMVHYRTVAEHLGFSDEKATCNTRHVDANWLEKVILCPYNINYHLAHHLFPSVPYYNLPALHERLLKEPVYADKRRIRGGYFGADSVWEEIVTG